MPLKDVSKNQDIIFSVKILNGDADRPELLHEVNFRINVKCTRSQNFLMSDLPYGQKILLDRLISCFNESSDIDPFVDSTNSIKNKLKCNFVKCKCKQD